MLFRFDAAFRREFREHWLVLVISTSCLLFSATVTSFALPFVYPAVISEFGWGREETMLIASTKYGVGVVAALLVGRLIDSFGAWKMLLATSIVSGISMISFLWIEDLSAWILAGVLMGFATPGGIVAANYLVLKSYNLSQGTALGLVLLGASIGSIIIPPSITLLIAEFGWRVGFASLSGAIWVIVVPLILFGANRHGRRESASPPPTAEAGSRLADPGLERQSTWAMLGRIMGQRNFWLIAPAIFVVSIVDSSFTQHQVLILRDFGFTAAAVAAVASATGLVSIPGRLMVGNLLDSFSNKALTVFYAALGLAALAAFTLAAPGVVAIYVLLRACGHAAVLLDTVVAKHIFGLNNLGSLVGMFTALSSLGFATGPWLTGRIFDTSGSYDLAFAFYILLTAAAAIAAWFVKPTYWLALRSAK